MDLLKKSISSVVAEVKSAMNKVVRDSSYSRDQVVDLVNELASDHRIKLVGNGGLTKNTLEKWLSVEDESRVPNVKGLMFFCGAMETMKPLEIMVQFLGGQIINSGDIPLLDWARLYQNTKIHENKMQKMEEKLWAK